jgi:hypothetical protein
MPAAFPAPADQGRTGRLQTRIAVVILQNRVLQGDQPLMLVFVDALFRAAVKFEQVQV